MNEIRTIRPGEAQSFSVEAEQQLIGNVLANNNRFFKVSDLIRAQMFYDSAHQAIWAQIEKLVGDGDPATIVTVGHALRADAALAELGGNAYLVRLTGAAMGSHGIATYAEIVDECFRSRSLVAAAQAVIDQTGNGVKPDKVAADLQTAIAAVPSRAKAMFASTTSAMTATITEMNGSYQGQEQLISTGIPALDDIVGGFGPAEMILLGGSTSMGKTATAVQIAFENAKSARPDERVIFPSLEMTQTRLMQRLISMKTGIPYSKMREANKLDEAEFRKVVAAAAELGVENPLPLDVIPSTVRTIGELDIAFNSIMNNYHAKPRLILIDYAQLVRVPGLKKIDEMSRVADWMQERAASLNCPIIGLVQIDRRIGERPDRRPQLYDIRESGQFENNADQVIFCYREEYWLVKDGPAVDKSGKVTDEARADWEADMARSKNKIELIVRKGRSTDLGTAKAGFHPPTNRFWKLEDSAF